MFILQIEIAIANVVGVFFDMVPCTQTHTSLCTHVHTRFHIYIYISIYVYIDMIKERACICIIYILKFRETKLSKI